MYEGRLTVRLFPLGDLKGGRKERRRGDRGSMIGSDEMVQDSITGYLLFGKGICWHRL